VAGADDAKRGRGYLEFLRIPPLRPPTVPLSIYPAYFCGIVALQSELIIKVELMIPTVRVIMHACRPACR